MSPHDSAASGPGTATDRRTLVKGAAWSVPALATVAAAPAVAASLPIAFRHVTTWRIAQRAAWCTDSGGLEINTTEGGGVTFTNTRAGTTITGVTATFWFARGDLVWSAASGNSGCWTAPAATGASKTEGGRTYYAYLSTYSCAVSAIEGTTTLLPYRWQTQCLDLDDTAVYDANRWVDRDAFATVNGNAVAHTIPAFQITTVLPAPGAGDATSTPASGVITH